LEIINKSYYDAWPTKYQDSQITVVFFFKFWVSSLVLERLDCCCAVKGWQSGMFNHLAEDLRQYVL